MINICYFHGLNQSLLAKFAQLSEAKSLFPFSTAIWDRLLRSNRCDSRTRVILTRFLVRGVQLNWLPF